MFKKKSNATTFVTIFVLALGLSAVSLASVQAASTSINVCVNKTSKAVFFKKACSKSETALRIGSATDGLSAFEIWKKAGNTGTEIDFLKSLKGADGINGTNGINGSNGSNGTSGNNWNIGTTCSQKLSLAEYAGQRLAFKQTRDLFETNTACSVERILGTLNDDLRLAGFPYVSSLQRLSLYESGSGGGGVLDVPGSQTFRIEYRIRLGNLSEASTKYGSPLTVCTTTDTDIINVDRPETVTGTLDPAEFTYSTYLEANSFANYFRAPMHLALCDGNSMAITLYSEINEDPAILGTDLDPGFDAGFARKWGWSN